ncbi:MAG: exodeoxyribonuclease VII small subunit [Muribaculaceae bacterium]|nr:exodeoxyribonuclease VII small subunit [Muribaculaceae bacterium]
MEPIEFVPVAELTYAAALAELEGILKKMQSDECDIDRLVVYTRRASELLAECRRRLTVTDEELTAILTKLEN